MDKLDNIESDNIVLLHGTSFTAIESMFKQGEMIPQGSNGSLALESPELYNEEDYKGYLFFTDFLPIAVDYSTMAISNTGTYYGNTVAILQVELKKDDLLPDVMDVKAAENWEESLEMGHQARVKGNIDISEIKSVLLVDYDNLEILYKCSNWNELKAYLDIKHSKT